MTPKESTEFEIMKADVKAIKENSERLNKEFDKLMFHLVGDKTTDTNGIIQDFRNIKIRLSRVEKFYIVIAGIVGFGISGITLWIKKYM